MSKRFWYWFWGPPSAPKRHLKCECGHNRSSHYAGRLACLDRHERDGQFLGLGLCPCWKYIPADYDPVSELERIAKL